ncbi:MAG: AEC family transporter [Burkholderiales bacterium]|nr:AEC family transporter [Burkholderiales bacterium]
MGYINLSVMCLFAFLGCLSRQKNIVVPSFLVVINRAITFILLPCIILAAMTKLTIDNTIWILPISNIFIVVLMALFSIIVCRSLKLTRSTSGAITTAFCSLEGGSIGLALMLILFGNKFLPQFFIFDITHALILFTFTYFLAYIYGNSVNLNLKLIRSFLFGPIPLSVALGILLNLINYQLNDITYNILNFIGYLILPAVMFILGYRFVYSSQHVLFAIMFTVIKLLIGILLGLSFIYFFNVHDYGTKIVILLSSALPPSFLTLVFAEEQNLNSELLAAYLPISSLISFVVILTTVSLFLK